MDKASLLRFSGMLVLLYAFVYTFQTGFGILKAVLIVAGILLYAAGFSLKDKSASA